MLDRNINLLLSLLKVMLPYLNMLSFSRGCFIVRNNKADLLSRCLGIGEMFFGIGRLLTMSCIQRVSWCV